MFSINHWFSEVPSVGLQGSLAKSKLFGHLSENVTCVKLEGKNQKAGTSIVPRNEYKPMSIWVTEMPYFRPSKLVDFVSPDIACLEIA
jgi:hypothetical protein